MDRSATGSACPDVHELSPWVRRRSFQYLRSQLPDVCVVHAWSMRRRWTGSGLRPITTRMESDWDCITCLEWRDVRLGAVLPRSWESRARHGRARCDLDLDLYRSAIRYSVATSLITQHDISVECAECSCVLGCTLCRRGLRQRDSDRESELESRRRGARRDGNRWPMDPRKAAQNARKRGRHPGVSQLPDSAHLRRRRAVSPRRPSEPKRADPCPLGPNHALT
jgi:hypothetical protein